MWNTCEIKFTSKESTSNKSIASEDTTKTKRIKKSEENKDNEIEKTTATISRDTSIQCFPNANENARDNVADRKALPTSQDT